VHTLIVVDFASTDGAPGLVRRWAENHPDTGLILVEGPARGSKAYALNTALKHVPPDAEIVILTDTDPLWPSRGPP